LAAIFFRKSSLTRVPGVRYRAEKKLFNYETVAILPTGPINPIQTKFGLRVILSSGEKYNEKPKLCGFRSYYPLKGCSPARGEAL
jgi:hypothetical protein